MARSTVRGRVVSTSDLGHRGVAQLFGLFSEHFEQASPDVFERDLETKDLVLLLDDAEGAPQGFSTLAFYKTLVGGREMSVVYSGDTIVRPAYWNSLELSKLWIRTVLALSEDMPKPVYWLLISSGFRTYRFMPVFFREFYPRHDRPTPQDVLHLMNHLASHRFGRDFDRGTGIVRFGVGATPLKRGLGEPTAKRLEDPHVAFFVERNPGHGRGDELVCLTEVSAANLTPAGLRMAGLQEPEWI